MRSAVPGSVERAERTILIENRYLTATRFAERQLRAPSEARSGNHRAEDLALLARGQTMRAGLGRFMRRLDPELRDRVALLLRGSRQVDERRTS